MFRTVIEKEQEVYRNQCSEQSLVNIKIEPWHVLTSRSYEAFSCPYVQNLIFFNLTEAFTDTIIVKLDELKLFVSKHHVRKNIGTSV